MNKLLLNIKQNIKYYEDKQLAPNTVQYLLHLVTIYTELLACEGLKHIDIEKFELELKEHKSKESENEIDHELKIANDYYNYYLKIKDADYLTMTKDRLSHAYKFIIEDKEKSETEKEKKYLDDKLIEYNELMKKLEMWK